VSGKAPTVASVRREIARRLTPTSPTAALDARVLVAHLIGCVPVQLALRDEEEVSEAFAARALALGERRAAGEPVARIIGEKEFFGMMLRLSPDTLIPRPDTETLVETALATIAEDWSRSATLKILDLGTGSGAIILALLSRLPNATGVGIDIAPGAIQTAQANAEWLGLNDRLTLTVGDWTKDVRTRFDVVVSNPPYIETRVIPGLQVEVREHDPHLALDGGADGLDAVHAIVADLDRVLSTDGVAFIEIGQGQAALVRDLAGIQGFRTEFAADLAGIERVAVLRRVGDV
jgi:release factor glutamine methyltransferase